ncbi:MAG: PAS domain-containing protein [Deltaproteobacteria bacterium]|nr:PAS domain-containing protein [Deltaproteobacteria bacterium]
MNEKSLDRLIATLPCALYEYVRWPDGSSKFIYVSAQVEDLFGWSAPEAMEDAMKLWGAVHPEDLERLLAEDKEANESRTRFDSEFRILARSGETKWLHLTSMPSDETHEGQEIWRGVMLDVTPRKSAELEQERLRGELKVAHADLEALSGLLPICLYCKKIRDDAGYWQKVESYLARHSQAKFSHGCCPDCADRLSHEAGLEATAEEAS